jgi:hypothetical protein
VREFVFLEERHALFGEVFVPVEFVDFPGIIGDPSGVDAGSAFVRCSLAG